MSRRKGNSRSGYGGLSGTTEAMGYEIEWREIWKFNRGRGNLMDKRESNLTRWPWQIDLTRQGAGEGTR